MIKHTALPAWESIFSNAGVKPLKRGRGFCPFCGSRTGFSCDERKGFYCFACNAHGDKISFIQKLNNCDFKGALRYFGMREGKPSAPDNASARHKVAMERMRQWVRTTGRRLRDEYLSRQRITCHARKRLLMDPDDEVAWAMLRIAYDGEAKNEFLLDEIDLCRADEERLRAWRAYRNEP